MRMYDMIKKKRDGFPLTDEEIQGFIRGYVKGEIPDYQAAALCMAIYYKGMTVEETPALTLAIRDSGDKLSLDVGGLRVDKHSTGGVGDKTSLVIAPIVAALGVKVAKMSGRGLGHTGGTIDKLESFTGFRTDLTTEEFLSVVDKTGLAIVGQSADLAPADKKLYALRDVTATVDSIPLIASSIMGKKLAADDDCIVLDVKCGSGAFMKSVTESRTLAQLMVDIGKRAGKRMCALLTDMDTPLGFAIGNSLEVIEAIETLKGNGPKDLTDICIALAARMLTLADHGTYEECERQVQDAIASGKALDNLAAMVEAQGGDPQWVYNTDLFPKAKYSRQVVAPTSGYIFRVDAERYGTACLVMGAGRNTLTDAIDHSAGIYLHAKVGDYVEAGTPLATLYTCRESTLDTAEQVFLEATELCDSQPEKIPLIIDVVT